MTFRTKLLLLSSLTVAGAVALATGAASLATRRAFERVDESRRVALLDQFAQEMRAQGLEVGAKVESAAESDAVARIAAEAAHREPDFASFYNSAQGVAENVGLDFLDVTFLDTARGLDDAKRLTILSSAHWPARFGYKNDWAGCAPCDSKAAFLVRVALPDGRTAVALAAARRMSGVILIGARRLDPTFLKSLGHAPGMRALLWFSPQEAFDAEGLIANPESLQAIVVQAQGGSRTAARLGDEAFLALPLQERGRLIGVLLAASSLREQASLEQAILWIGVSVAGSAILLGLLLGWWTTERVTRPVEQLARAARAVADGDWPAQVEVASHDEIGELARAFNRMTARLIEQRDRALQAERVAAWRELARRLAHELKNPLFPLQIAIENLRRVRSARPEEFDEVLQETTGTLLDEVKNLNKIIGRFSDFSRMPAPRFETVEINAAVQEALRLYALQLSAQKNIIVTTALSDGGIAAEVDPDQLRRALGNLILNAVDAMKDGGSLRVSTQVFDDTVRIEVSDTGQGLTEEERVRLFTPYYTTKQHGTGLGLAIVQSVVSDHGGKISVESQPGKGATFVVDLPLKQRREARA